MASIVLWVQSYRYAEWLSWTPTPTPTEKRSFGLHVRHGGIVFEGGKSTRTHVEPDWDESGSREIWNQSGFEWRKGSANAFARNAARFRWEWIINAPYSKVLIAEAPIWAVSVCLLVLTQLLGWRGWPGRRKPNTCATCGYNLTGNSSGVCPECGTPIPAKGVA